MLDSLLELVAIGYVVVHSHHRVIGPAAEVDQALRLLDEGRPDAALLDVHLRGEIVTPVADALRRAKIPFLLASAFGAAELGRCGLDGAARNVGKPVEPQRLLAALADIGCGTRARP